MLLAVFHKSNRKKMFMTLCVLSGCELPQPQPSIAYFLISA